MDLEFAVKLCKEAEGFRSSMYRCPAGAPTIGFGRNLNVYPLSNLEVQECAINENGEVVCTPAIAEKWLVNILTEHKEKLSTFGWYRGKAERRAVLLDLVYNLGLPKFLTFEKFLHAMLIEDYPTAANELQDSKWYSQVGLRGVRNCRIILTGEMTLLDR